MTLPQCRFRQPKDAGFRCDSPLLNIHGTVPPEICLGCPVPDLEQHPTPTGVDRAPCLYRGNLARLAPRAYGPDRGTPVEVYSCGIHGECSEQRVVEGITCCVVCPHFRPRDTSPAAANTPANSVETMLVMLRGPRRDWSEDWANWGTTLEAHRILAAETANTCPPYPHNHFHGRGIVILGGGPFFPGVYVTVHMLRHFGCTLPIEVWHRASVEPVLAYWLEPLGVRFVDIDTHMDQLDLPPRLRGAWANKVHAILHSSFEEILYLDSDCYPVGDVTPLFDHLETGTVLWANPGVFGDQVHWHIYPTSHSGKPPINSGALLLNKARTWKALVLARWWNERADYTYQHGFGDQDIFRGVWQYLKQPFTMFAEDTPMDHEWNLIFPGPDGTTPLFVHRTIDKFRLPGLPLHSSDSKVPLYHAQGLPPGEPWSHPDLPAEDVAFRYFHDFKRRFDADPARYRAGTWDQIIWEEIALYNVYNLPDSLPANSLVIDVGCHIGAFTHLALRRGAGRVWAFEIDPNNYRRCCANLALWGQRVVLRHQAVWSHTGRVGFAPPDDNTGTGRVLPRGSTLPSIALDEILTEVAEEGDGTIHLLKLDCEGAEWPVLQTAQRLQLCERIVGEYHVSDWQGQSLGAEHIHQILAPKGFTVRTSPSGPDKGLFWASRVGL